ncbi:MAG: hypothetical protein JXJ20_00985 [Anaerolineae bacterium]|nr:hypothetical protein [Anaerolineae bacterium]
MRTSGKMHGGAIHSGNQNTFGIVELLTHHYQNQLELVYYTHPKEIEVEAQHEFIIVLSLHDLEQVIRHYDDKRCPLPLIVHINEPDVMQNINHRRMFPGVEIMPVEQANLANDPDITLELSLLAKIMDRLALMTGRAARQQ